MCGVPKSKDFVKVNRQRGRPHHDHQAWAGARAGGRRGDQGKLSHFSIKPTKKPMHKQIGEN